VTKLVVIPADPIHLYLNKGEIKERYWNPCNFFDEIHILDLSSVVVKPEDMQAVAGNAKLHIHTMGDVSILKLPSFFRKIRKKVGELKPDLIRAHGPRPSSSFAVHAGKKNNIPTVSSVHNEGDEQRKYEKNWKFYAAILFEYHTFKNSDTILCVADYLQPYVRKYGGKNLVTIYNKVYLDKFKPKQIKAELTSSNRPLNILTVMRLDNQKDPFSIVEAIKGLNAHLTIIGQGDIENDVKKLVKKLELTQQVTMIPSVPNKDIPTYYHNTDIFVMSTKYEGFCIPILEAMAAETTVVSCDTMPIPEILGETGIIVPRNKTGFHEAFKNIIENPQILKQNADKQLIRAQEIDGYQMEKKEKELYIKLIDDRANSKK